MHSTNAIVIVLSFGYIHEANMLQPITLTLTLTLFFFYTLVPFILGSRVVRVLDSVAEGPGFKSQSRR